MEIYRGEQVRISGWFRFFPQDEDEEEQDNDGDAGTNVDAQTDSQAAWRGLIVPSETEMITASHLTPALCPKEANYEEPVASKQDAWLQDAWLHWTVFVELDASFFCPSLRDQHHIFKF